MAIDFDEEQDRNSNDDKVIQTPQNHPEVEQTSAIINI